MRSLSSANYVVPIHISLVLIKLIDKFDEINIVNSDHSQLLLLQFYCPLHSACTDIVHEVEEPLVGRHCTHNQCQLSLLYSCSPYLVFYRYSTHYYRCVCRIVVVVRYHTYSTNKSFRFILIRLTSEFVEAGD